MNVQDYSFLRFYTSFAVAKNSDNPAISTLRYQGFLQMLPTETWFQISNSNTPISFVGGITVELVDCGENVVQNITSQFFYEIFSDENGIDQIRYEFGNINVDYWSTPLYLRITDNTNLNVWYSNNFLLTANNSRLSARFDYWHPAKLNGTTYDGLHASIRFADFYHNDIADEENSKQYTQFEGSVVDYRSIITPLDEYNISGMDIFTFRRLQRLCQCPFVYLNGVRVTRTDIKKDKREGDANWFAATFTCNPTNELFTFAYQFYEPFNQVSRFVANNSVYTLSGFNTAIGVAGIYINFNKAPNLTAGFEYKLYKDDILVLTSSANSIATNKLTLTALSSYTFANGSYSLVVNTVYNGIEYWGGFPIDTWNWTIQDGEFDADDFTNDFLID